MATGQTGYLVFDKDNSAVTKTLKQSVGKLDVEDTQECTSKSIAQRFNYLLADFLWKVQILFRFFHHKILFLIVKWDR